ncbi:MAG TPA: alpha/beta fold hydrolase, partial [Pseudonocardiaceae bacterium]
MTVVFVHGNPESEAIWGPLLAELGREDVLRLSPPGFGAPVPDGFGATVTEYRDWLIEALTALGEPVHLIGHDWGGGHVVNVAMHRPDLLLSWASDVLGLFDPDYVWHDLAQVWQTPGAGEESLARMTGGTEQDRATGLAGLGFPPDAAAEVAKAQGPDMARCILALYRSAAQPAMAELGRDLERAAAKP